MICPNCHETNREAARFCKRCGLWLGENCPNCGTDLPETPIFCDQCGFQVSRVLAAGSQPTIQGARPAVAVTQDRPVLEPPAIPPDQAPALASRPSAAETQDAAPAVTPLQKYIPQELMTKLEAARVSGTMSGERRIVTMLFCDVIGSTAAAEGLDPEDWTAIINGAFEHMIKPVYKYEGTVARLMGDAILAFFGAPISHEDDPQRAVLAGLEIVKAMEPYRESVSRRFGIDFNVRVGINTGMVVVGAVGSDLRMEYTAMGDAINLAARMEQTAQPGTVQIAHDTYKQVAPLFEVEDIGGIEVKGKEEPVPAYRVLRRKLQAGRLRGIAGLDVPMVGRSREMSDLQAAFNRARKGVGGIICMIGEAGLGKSRLIRELKATLPPDEEISWYETSSLSYESSQPYNLFRRLIRRVAGAAPNDPPEIMRQKIGTIFEGLDLVDREQMQRVFESLFGLSGVDGEPPLEGETFKQLFVSATRTLWQVRANRSPTVLACDDLHWADRASVTLLQELFGLTEKVPLLILCSFRPEREAPGWELKTTADTNYTHRYTEILLKPLSEAESLTLLSSMALTDEIPAVLIQRILEKAAGIPYYLEEVVRSLIESKALERENGHYRWAAGIDYADIHLPDNLQSLLVARIDRLQEDTKRILQLASVIGRSFYYRVLARIENGSQTLDGQLNQLIRVNMIREAARDPEPEYVFSNVLTQEAAYETLLLQNRRQFHKQVGEALESLFPERLEELAPVLTVHFSLSGNEGKSFTYLVLSGDAAYRVYALDEAVTHYQQALEIALHGTQVQVSPDQLIHLFTRLGRAYEHKYQFDSADEIYEKMRREADARKDRVLMLAYLLARGTLYVTFNPLGDPEKGKAFAEQALSLADELGDRQAEAKAHWNLLLLHRFFTLDLVEAKRNGEISLQIARELGFEEQEAFTLNDLAFTYAGLGDLEQSMVSLEEAQEKWRKWGNLPMLTDNLNVSGMLYALAGELHRSISATKEGLQVADSINSLWNKPVLYHNASRAYQETGEYGLAVQNAELLKQMVIERDGRGSELYFLYLVPLIYSDLGLFKRAMKICRQGIDLLKENEGPFARVEELYYTVQARLYLASYDFNAAREMVALIHPKPETASGFPYVDLFLLPILFEVFIGLGEYENVLTMGKMYTASLEESGVKLYLADGYYQMGRAYWALGKMDQAREMLSKAREIASGIGSRRILWQILRLLAEMEALEGNVDKAESLRMQAREIVTTIAEHTSPEEYRTSFLCLPEVSALLEGTSTTD